MYKKNRHAGYMYAANTKTMSDMLCSTAMPISRNHTLQVHGVGQQLMQHQHHKLIETDAISQAFWQPYAASPRC
jgi:hypothetical protein